MPKTIPRKRYLGILLAIFAVLAPFVVFALPRIADSPIKSFIPRHVSPPSITWSEPRITINLSPGQTVNRQVSLTSDQAATGLRLEGVPEIAPFLTIQPASIGSIGANQFQLISLSFTAPVQSELGTYKGTVHVRSDQQALPANLKIIIHNTFEIYSNPDLGITFQYPTLPAEANISIDQQSSIRTAINIQLRDSTDGHFYPVFGLVIYNNPNQQSLEQWFGSNVDSDNVLLTTAIFQHQQLDNGYFSLVRLKPIPSQYENGPVAEAYAISPSNGKIISIEQAQDSSLSSLNYSQESIRILMRRILGSVQLK